MISTSSPERKESEDRSQESEAESQWWFPRAKSLGMPQDRFSGAKANRYGRQCAEQIAAALGAEPMNNASNEYLLDEERVVIKCARIRTTAVGVTYQMLNRIAAVLGAFERVDGSYRVLRLPAQR